MNPSASGDPPASPALVARVSSALGFSDAAHRRAMELAGVPPSRESWSNAIDRFLLLFGFMCVLVGVAAFFAYNWGGLHKFAKFALVEAGIVACVALCLWRGIDHVVGRAALLAAAVLTGILFALYGQTYQTGADPYGLFLVWAFLIAGWAVVGRQAGIWMLFLVLVNLGLILYWRQVLHPEDLAFVGQLLGPLAGLAGSLTDPGLAALVFLLNACALVLWERQSLSGATWAKGRAFARVVAAGMFVVAVTGTLFFMFGIQFGERDGWMLLSGPIFFTVFVVLSLWFYQYRQRDLFMLTATSVSIITVVTAFIARSAGGVSEALALLLAVLVIGQTAGAAYWLRSVVQRWHIA